MRQRIDFDELWRSAREQAMLVYEGAQQDRVRALPVDSVFALDDLFEKRIDTLRLVEDLQEKLLDQPSS